MRGYDDQQSIRKTTFRYALIVWIGISGDIPPCRTDRQHRVYYLKLGLILAKHATKVDYNLQDSALCGYFGFAKQTYNNHEQK